MYIYIYLQVHREDGRKLKNECYYHIPEQEMHLKEAETTCTKRTSPETEVETCGNRWVLG